MRNDRVLVGLGEIKGRRITATIAAWLLLPALRVVGAAVGGARVTVGAWITYVGLQTLLAWLLYQGYRWVRLVTIASCGFMVVTGVIRLLTSGASVPIGPTIRLPIIVSVSVQAFVGLVLWRSSSVRAYFDRQDQATSLHINDA
jgi:hypothetical protein